MSRSLPRVEACWLGRVPYRLAWDLQKALVAQVHEGSSPDTLLLLEHPHVFTMGRRAVEEHVLWDAAERAARGVELVWCDRGGDVTYHGPGQLVGYPILDLRRHGGDVLAYIRKLELSLVRYLSSVGLDAGPVQGLTGVWSQGEKVAAIGVRLTDSVVSHGFALNLDTDLEYFRGIVPCGLHDRRATSVRAVSGTTLSVQRAARDYAKLFASTFDVAIRWRKEISLPNVITGSESALELRLRPEPARL